MKRFSSPLNIVLLLIVLINCACVPIVSDSEQELLYDGPVQYGVRWSLLKPNDPGERCFSAIGKTVEIGIGDSGGFSDFDSIYPWSDIRRCNIMINGDVIYEGEPGFTIDGSNGDVFVRIPRFYYDHYLQDGYEYRTVLENGNKVHPAFIEKGQVLDEIFIAAFEGFLDDNNKLSSVAGVIPSSNHTGEFFLSSAKKKGTNYSLYDNRAIDAIYTLMSVEFGLRNTNHFLGYGFADYWQPVYNGDNRIVEVAERTNTVRIQLLPAHLRQSMPVGSNITICGNKNQQNIIAQRTITSIIDEKNTTIIAFDGPPISVDLECFVGSAACTTNFCESFGDKRNLRWHTGRAEFIKGSETLNPIRYRWMENLWGSLWHFLPDVTFLNAQMYVCGDMSEYDMFKTDSPYLPVGPSFSINKDNGVKSDVLGYNYWINSFCPELFEIGIVFGESFEKGLNSKKSFGAYYYLADGLVCIVNGGGFDHLYRCNILTQRAWMRSNTSWYLYGARLMYKQLNKGKETLL